MRNERESRLFLELFLGAITLLFFVILGGAISIFAVIPVSNYHTAMGMVSYKNQIELTSQVEGVITKTFVENHSFVKSNSPIFEYRSEENSRTLEESLIQKKHLENELKTYQKLFRSGLIERTVVKSRELALQQLNSKISFLQKNNIVTPWEGYIYFDRRPENQLGSFVSKGQRLAYIYKSTEKHIHVTFPNIYADRFKIGAPVVVKYKDPANFRVQKMNGSITSSFVDQNSSELHLFCDITEGVEHLASFTPSTIVETSVLVNASSLFEDVFNVRLELKWYDAIKKRLL